MTDVAAPPVDGERAEGGGPGPRPLTLRRRAQRKRLRYLMVLGLLGAALVFLLVEGLGNSLDYYDTVDQALAHRADLGTSTFRLEGVVLPHTVHATARGADFSVGEGRRAIAVHNVGSPPELFQVGIPVIVVGHFAPGGGVVFESNQIMVKHSANYTPATTATRPASSTRRR